MATRYVIDTVAFINYFNEFFGEEDILSSDVRRIVKKCIGIDYNHYKLIIPSIVFLEVFRKFLKSEERAKQFYYEIFIPLRDADDIEVKPIEKEVISTFSQIDSEVDLELHDKIIFASALQLQCTLITNDPKILKANKAFQYIPDIIF